MKAPHPGQQAGSNAKRNRVGQRIQLLAELTGSVGHPRDAPVQAVSARGVDFNNREQVRQFYVKLHAAAQAVCDAGSPTPRAYAVDAGCVRQVVAKAVKAADKPVLTALYNTSADSNRAFAGNDQ